ncbi:PKD domain-containing protein [Candidatus Dojkabacteria bacterium]|nr:PKD domain-containing protein [Candidatus Dojkabacteria bacterium]
MRLLVKIILLVFLTVTFGISCEKENQPPTCRITTPSNGAEFDQGEIVTISVDADDPDGNIIEVRFYINDIGVSSSNNFPYSYNWNTSGETEGIHTIKSNAKDNNGSSTTDQISILIKEPVTPPVSDFTAYPTTISTGESVQFTDQSTNNPTSWNWSFGDGGTSSIQNPSHTFNTVGLYTISLTVSNSDGSDTEIKANLVTVSSAIETLTDIDGNTYQIVHIGNQIWMAENLRVTHYSDGSPIPQVENNSSWATLKASDKAYCWYDNDISYKATYGALYTWSAAMNGARNSNSKPSGIQGVCPDSWHLPSNEEWIELTEYLGGSSIAGGKIKETGTNHWNSPNSGATNETGFTALPSGLRDWDGMFKALGNLGHWWSTTLYSGTLNAYIYSVGYDYQELVEYTLPSNWGLSVRCLKD